MSKSRITITVQKAFIDAARQAIAEGRADSVSGWIQSALAREVEEERRRAALASVIREYEAEHGVITAEEMEAQRRADLRAARAGRKRLPRRQQRRCSWRSRTTVTRS